MISIIKDYNLPEIVLNNKIYYTGNKLDGNCFIPMHDIGYPNLFSVVVSNNNQIVHSLYDLTEAVVVNDNAPYVVTGSDEGVSVLSYSDANSSFTLSTVTSGQLVTSTIAGYSSFSVTMEDIGKRGIDITLTDADLPTDGTKSKSIGLQNDNGGLLIDGTNSDGTTRRTVIGSVEAHTLLSQVSETIVEVDTYTLAQDHAVASDVEIDIIYVVDDATDDVTVDNGSAIYLKLKQTTTLIPLLQSDIDPSWDMYTPLLKTDIESAVDNRHEHSNIAVLDGISLTDGRLTYNSVVLGEFDDLTWN